MQNDCHDAISAQTSDQLPCVPFGFPGDTTPRVTDSSYVLIYQTKRVGLQVHQGAAGPAFTILDEMFGSRGLVISNAGSQTSKGIVKAPLQKWSENQSSLDGCSMKQARLLEAAMMD